MAHRQYLNFDLGFTQGPEGRYVARVTSSPAGDGSNEFEIPFNDLALENFYLKMGRPRHGVRAAGSSEAKAAREHGESLFNAVFQGRVREAFSGSRAVADSRHDDVGQRYGLRIRLNLTDTPELGELPWEFLWDPIHRNHVVTSERTPIVRYLDAPTPVTPLTVDGPLRMLCVISDPSGVVPLDVEHEWVLLQQALGGLIDEGRLQLNRLEPATLGALHAALSADDYHILHFVGHGAFDADRGDHGEGFLVFETESGAPEQVPADRLAVLIQDEDSLRLVVLNACEGARAGKGDVYSGTAQTLVFAGIPAVVGMQFEFTDDAAIALAKELYQAIAHGYPIDAAVGEARKAIYASHNDIEWGTPVLFMRTPDGELFAVDSTPKAVPESPREAAAAALTAGDYQSAVALYKELQRRLPDDEPSRLGLDHAETMLAADRAYAELAVLADQRRWSELVGQLDRLAQAAPEYPDRFAYRDQATSALALESQRQEAAGLIGEGRQLLEVEDYDAAVDAFERAALLDPELAETEELLEEAFDRARAAELSSEAIAAMGANDPVQAGDLLTELEQLPDDVIEPYTELIVDLREQEAAALAPVQDADEATPPSAYSRLRYSPRTALAILAGLVGIGLVIALIAALWPDPPTPRRLGAVIVAAGDPIEIRAMQTLTVDDPNDDEAIKTALDQMRGIELAITDFGTVHDRVVRLGEIVDDQCNAEGGTAAAAAIRGQTGIVGVIGPTCSSAAIPAAEILSDEGLVLISASSRDPALTTTGDGAGADWQPGFYRTAPNEVQHGVAAANFIREELGAQTAVALHLAGTPITRTVADAFADELRDLGGDVRTEEVTLSDLEADLVRISDDPGEVIYFYTADPIEGVALAQMLRMIPALDNIPLVSSQLLFFDEFLQTSESAGMHFSLTDLLFGGNVSSTGVAYEDLTTRYEATYGEPPQTNSAVHAYAYDATVLLLSAINSVAVELDDGELSIDRLALREALVEVKDLPGITGALRCQPFGDCGDPSLSIVHHLDPRRPDQARSNVVYIYTP